MRPMRVKDIMTAVQKAGYETNSKGFYGLVATAVREGGFAPDFLDENHSLCTIRHPLTA